MFNNGAIISVGNVSNETSKINILPLILRGVKIIGINAESTNNEVRKKIWKEISNIANNKKIKLLYKEYNFYNSIKIFKKMSYNNHVGRIIIKI